MRMPRPPMALLWSLGAMAATHSVAPLLPLPGWPLTLAGIGLSLAGFSLSLACKRQLRRQATTIDTFAMPDQLVYTGLFRYSRNPIYLGLVVALLGLALTFGSLSPLLIWIGFCLLLDRYYIPLEERHLHQAFGQTYDHYRQQVRRWL